MTQVRWSFEPELEPRRLTGQCLCTRHLGCVWAVDVCVPVTASSPRRPQGRIRWLGTYPGIRLPFCSICSPQGHLVREDDHRDEEDVWAAAVCPGQNFLTFYWIFRIVPLKERIFSVGILLIIRTCHPPGGWYCFHFVLMAPKEFSHV